MANCKVCGIELHPIRSKMGYKNCIDHSTVEKYTGILMVDGKTDYSIQIIKDPEVGRKLMNLASTHGKV